MLDPKRDLFRWGPISACPLFMYYTIKPSFKPMKDLFGHCYPFSLVIFKNKKVTWLLDMEEFSKSSKEFVSSVIENDKSLSSYMTIWEEYTVELNNLLNTINQTKLEKLSKSELIKQFTQFSEVYYKWWTCTMSVELVTVTIEKNLSFELKKHYKDKDEREYNQDLAVLSSPIELTFYRQEQFDILQLLNTSGPIRKEGLQKHQEKYHWILNSYLEGKLLGVEYFEQELEKYEQNNTDSLNILADIKNYTDEIKRNKADILNKLDKDDKLKRLIELVEIFSIKQDQRKAINFRADHFLELFVRAFESKTIYNSSEIKLSLEEELITSEINLDSELLKNRSKCLVFSCTDTKIEEINGEEAEQINNTYEKPKDIEQSVLHGMLASSGNTHYFRGNARIIHTIDEIDKLSQGEILITTMTSPDFVVGMKRAGAIITDTGGMLCHAAIVSRELGKPCIVGTEVATKVIKDGDVVELHCARGTVKIIKS